MFRYVLYILSIISLFLFTGCGSSKFQHAMLKKNYPLAKQEIIKMTDQEEINNALVKSCFYNNLELVKLAASKGARLNKKHGGYDSCLSEVLYNGNYDMAKFLISNNIFTQHYYNTALPFNKLVIKVFRDNKYHYHFNNKQLKVMKYIIDNTPITTYKLHRLDDAFYDEMIAAKNDLLKQYNKYISKLNNQKIEQQKLVKEKKHKETIQIKVDNFIKAKDFQGLKQYTDKNPNAVYYIQDETIRLLLTGPKGMKVGDIKKLINEKKSEVLIISLIKRVKSPYKEYTIQEIERLQTLGLSDNIIAAMIDVTTKLMDNQKLKEQQEFYLKEQRKLKQQQTQIIYKSEGTNNQTIIVDKITDKVINKGVNMIFEKLF